MKKIICTILAVSMLFLASCSSKQVAYGIYYMEDSTSSYCRINYRSDSSFAILYGASSERGSCVKENNKLTVDVDDSDCFYVFNIKDGKLIYNESESTPSEEFASSGIIKDGDVFFLIHESNGK